MNVTTLRSKRVVLPALAAVAALAAGGLVWGSAANADLSGSERDRVAAAAARAAGGTAVEVEAGDDRGEAYEVEVRRADGTEVDVSLDKNLEVVSQRVDHDHGDHGDHGDTDHADEADGGDDTPDADDRALSTAERTSAEKAALDAVSGGSVTEVEPGDDPGEAYEVEVRRADGTEMHVSLDKDLKVVSRHVDRDDATESPDREDRALSASERSSAEKAALNAVNGGTVTEVEAGDDPGVAYEVEVRAGSTEWQVELAADFTVVHKTVDD